MTSTNNPRRVALCLILFFTALGITLANATTENNYKNETNLLPRISESTHTENGYKANIAINPHTTGIYAKENEYKTELTINPQGIGGKLTENNYKLDLIPEKTFSDMILNIPPTASNLAITPTSPLTTDDLHTSYTYTDADGDPESATEIRWYKNGILQSAYNDQTTLPSSATAKGDQWHFTVRPKDGTFFGNLQTSPTVTIQNSPPSIDGINITPDPAYTTDTLLATPYGWHDADGDPEGYVYQWQKWDGISWQNILGETSSTLSPANFVKGNQIKIVCTPYDGTGYGTPKEDSITISNSPPTIDSHHPLIDPTIQEGESQEFNITKSDLDGDPLTVTWWLNQTATGETSDSYTYTSNYESAGTYNVTVIVSDGDSQTSHQWTLTVTNVERDIAIINVIPSKNIVGQGYSVSINVTITNQGELTETFNLTAYANTTIIDTITNITLTSGNSRTITFTWNTTGFAKGNYTISAYAIPVTGETDIINNNCTDGSVLITKVGDLGSRVGSTNEFGVCDGLVTSTDLSLFLQCYKATAPTAYMYLGDLGSRVGTTNKFFACDGSVTSTDLSLFLQCYKGTGP